MSQDAKDFDEDELIKQLEALRDKGMLAPAHFDILVANMNAARMMAERSQEEHPLWKRNMHRVLESEQSRRLRIKKEQADGHGTLDALRAMVREKIEAGSLTPQQIIEAHFLLFRDPEGDIRESVHAYCTWSLTCPWEERISYYNWLVASNWDPEEILANGSRIDRLNLPLFPTGFQVQNYRLLGEMYPTHRALSHDGNPQPPDLRGIMKMGRPLTRWEEEESSSFLEGGYGESFTNSPDDLEVAERELEAQQQRLQHHQERLDMLQKLMEKLRRQHKPPPAYHARRY